MSEAGVDLQVTAVGGWLFSLCTIPDLSEQSTNLFLHPGMTLANPFCLKNNPI